MKCVDDMLIIPVVPATIESISGIKIGDMVRVKIDAPPFATERFWVEITQINDSFIVGTCEAMKMECTKIHGIRSGDKIQFSKKFISYVMPVGSPIEDFIALARKEGIIK